MKQNKKYFHNNRLNKGYKKYHNNEKSDHSFAKKIEKLQLPPLELLEQYEELFPGCTGKIFKMAESEQIHRHKLEVLEQESHKKISITARIFAVIYLFFIFLGTIILSLFSISVAISFIFFAFVALISVSYINKKL